MSLFDSWCHRQQVTVNSQQVHIRRSRLATGYYAITSTGDNYYHPDNNGSIVPFTSNQQPKANRFSSTRIL